MVLFHGSKTADIKVLEPRIADHEKPYVYLSTSEAVAAIYLCSAVEKPYYWFPYGFNENGIPVYHELYPNALREISECVKGYIYTVEADENQLIPFKNIPCARLSEKPLSISGCVEIQDAYELYLKYEREGKMRISRFENKTPEQLRAWYDMLISYLDEKDMKRNPSCSYARYIKSKLPQVWEEYILRTQI